MRHHVDRFAVLALVIAALVGATAPASAGVEPNWVMVRAVRVDDFIFPDAEFFLFVLVHVPDVDPTSVVVTTGGGLVFEFDGDPGDDNWDDEAEFGNFASLQAAIDGDWTVTIGGPAPSESTFSIDASGLADSDFYATPTDLFPEHGTTGVPPDVVLAWSDPTGEETADLLRLSVEGEAKMSDQEDDNVFGTLHITDTTWDPPLDLTEGFNEFSVVYLDVDDLERATPLVVQQGPIEWSNSPYAPKGYPAMTPLLTFGSESIVGFEVGPADACPGDIDDSGTVDFDDILAVLQAWGPYGDCPPFIPADVDEDCEVGFNDLLVVLGGWGPCP